MPAIIPSASQKRSLLEYFFCLVVGSMYIYAINRVIMSATFIQTGQSRLFVMGLAALIFFGIVLHNRYTRIFSGAIIIIVALFVFFTLERWEPQINHFYDIGRMIQGYIPYRPDLGNTVLWAVSLLLGLAVAIFMLYRFSFYILTLTGIAVFLFTWGPGFTRDAFSFLLFIFCFCLLLIRKTNNGLSAVYVAAPICAALVWFIHGNVPMEAELFQRRNIQELFDGPLSAVSDLIYTITNPMYFSFQSTGFSGSGGRLGGPITPNNRNVMTVQAPPRTYLAGATHNVYTGYRWVSTLEHGDLYTQGMAQGRFEMIETAAALIRGASLPDTRATIPTSMLWNMFPIYDHMHLGLRHFATLGLDGDLTNIYLHTYLPMDIATIAIGTNRTGTVFRANRTRQLWFHAAGPDYLPNLVFEPTGDIRAPGFMARNTQYSMSFLNVNPRLTFVADMLNGAFAGLYATREPYIPLVMLDFSIFHGGYIITFDPSGSVWAVREDGGESSYTWHFDFHPYDTSKIVAIAFYPYGITPQSDTGEDDSISSNMLQFVFDTLDIDLWVETLNNVFLYGGDRNPILPNFSDEIWEIVFLHGQAARGVGLNNFDFESMVVSAQDLNNVFDRFAHQSPTRELRYMDSHAELMAMLDIFSRDVLSRYAETVREHFMYVPEITPQRVHDLVEDIIYGLDTDFEKIMAIRNYLVQFPYTLSPQPVPTGVCFVDHFLFEGQEGYCTYYASAMAVMSRIAGVPSRYVEGFLLPPAETDPAVFIVTNRMAHAWVEVYLEGFGWLIVEATAPYAFFLDLEEPPPGLMTPDWQISGWSPDWYRDMLDDEMFTINGSDMSTIALPEGPDTTPTRDGASIAYARIYVLLSLAGVIVLTLIFLLVRYIQLAVKANKVRRLTVNQQIAAYFNGIINITSHCTNPKDPTETPYAYGQKMGRRFAFKSDSILLKDLVDLYYKARFGNGELSEPERKLMEDSYFDMVSHLRRENKKPNYFYLRYIRQIGALYA